MKIIKLVLAMALLSTVVSIILLAQADDCKAQVKLEAEVVPPAALCSIGDTVFYDYNGNGMQDSGEGGISGIQVNLYKDNGDGVFFPAGDDLVGSTFTNADGYYDFTDLDCGEAYWVEVVEDSLPAGLNLTTVGVAGTAGTEPIILDPEGEDYNDADFGYRPAAPTPIGVGGEAYPVNKLAILMPWIALFAAIVAAAETMLRRRRAQG